MRRSIYLWILSLVALSIFLWPFWTLGFAFDQGLIQILVIPAIVLCAGAALLILDGDLLGPKQIALLGLLSALGAAVRIATGGTGGFELVFAIVILGAAAFGSRFGFLLGAM
ncbi:MAG: ECF transporter S component, partial [bacterium]